MGVPGVRPPVMPPLFLPRRSYAWVWGLVGSLVVMAVIVVGGGIWLLTSGPQSYGDDARLDRMWDACDRGNMRACDRLYAESPLFSDYEEFGLTCGGRSAGRFECAP
jgi:hypothetical protein